MNLIRPKNKHETNKIYKCYKKKHFFFFIKMLKWNINEMFMRPNMFEDVWSLKKKKMNKISWCLYVFCCLLIQFNTFSVQNQKLYIKLFHQNSNVFLIHVIFCSFSTQSLKHFQSYNVTNTICYITFFLMLSEIGKANA